MALASYAGYDRYDRCLLLSDFLEVCIDCVVATTVARSLTMRARPRSWRIFLDRQKCFKLLFLFGKRYRLGLDRHGTIAFDRLTQVRKICLEADDRCRLNHVAQSSVRLSNIASQRIAFVAAFGKRVQTCTLPANRLANLHHMLNF